ncbi:family 43 glycosylhydrolase [Cohnella sp. CFH 77786]|uniref:glycoside hydrolase family 43 protein n=1 Tax=Cohnella sp. CFH 77786 TaxID=2662265 RepID=UPI001C60E1A4|nr:glycoside hydrolase family 43 protein [Cohnella sp. CFH 77786]MBW5449411.1 family 43 glycosylhydrolase [Cohnella sp. CFH 77786]
MSMIHNPILRGFNPDPSILRVGEDYYIATSTFEWYPGVQIHHSRDLVHWRVLTRPLDSARLLDMRGNPNSGGIWAPCLTYSDGLYYLLYTNVRSLAGAYKDTPNYLVTAESIEGPWSDPIYLNSSGFDPSLFHDDDGRKWVLNMIWDHRAGRNPFYGIVIQEYSVEQRRLVGEKRIIFKGTSLGGTEGPHLYKRGGYYYLMTAEGGTGYEHAVTVARSESMFGPYEVDPSNPMLTAFGAPELALQKAGHASLVETQTGEWYIAHLCARPIEGLQRSPLGRETALQRVEWTADGWLRLANGGNGGRRSRPSLGVPAPALAWHPFEALPERDDFDAASLAIWWNTLREPANESWLSLTERPGYLRLRGRESLNSMHEQSLVARRLQSLEAEAETRVSFSPESFQQMAGMVCYYNTKHYYYLHVTHDEELGKCLRIVASDNGVYSEPLGQGGIPLDDADGCCLRASISKAGLRFGYSLDGEAWETLGPTLDLSKLSDEYCTKFENGTFTDWGFTGTFVGLCAQDLTGKRLTADFDYFVYREME